MKVFRMNDYDWWADETLEKAIANYRADQLTMVNEDDIDTSDAYEVSDEAMEALRYHDDNGPTWSFREELNRRIAAGEPFPCLFASTEW